MLTPEGVTDNTPNVSKPVKKPSTWKSLCLFTNIFDIKNKIAKLRIGAAKSKSRAITVVTSHWTNKIKQKGI